MSFLKHDLSLKMIQPEDIETTVPFTYVWRDGGIRLQEENINEKLIFHNYGQGLSEFSLAYGCSYIVSKMITLKKESTKTKDVAVIGSGINALMTTLELLKRGHRVTLYAQKIPVRVLKGVKQIQPAAGLQYWYPGDYDNSDPLKHELISKLSFEFLRDSLKSNRYQSLSWSNLYASGPKSEQIKENVTDFITNEIGQVNIQFGNEKLQQFTYFRTIMIDTELFAEEVFTELKLRNINLVEKSFNTLNDVLNLKQQFVFNCLRGENKHIFGDQGVTQIPSYYILLKRTNPLKQSFAIWKSSQIETEQDFVLALNNKKVQLASRSRNLQQDNKNIQKEKEKLFTRAYHFIKERTVKAYKL